MPNTEDLPYCPHSPDGICYNGGECKTCIYHILWRETSTCNGCVDEMRCPFAYDLYNTNGDCLASK